LRNSRTASSKRALCRSPPVPRPSSPWPRLPSWRRGACSRVGRALGGGYAEHVAARGGGGGARESPRLFGRGAIR
jgi:hypothetical protein